MQQDCAGPGRLSMRDFAPPAPGASGRDYRGAGAASRRRPAVCATVVPSRCPRRPQPNQP